MKKNGSLLDNFIESLKILPGIGSKSAQRIAFYLLQKNRSGAKNLLTSLEKSLSQLTECNGCRNLTESLMCNICLHPKRQEKKQICIIETPMDLKSIEETGVYFGLYFILMGKLSPIEGIGPQDLKLDILDQRLASGKLCEIILATSSTLEGEATARYIANRAKKNNLKVTRIAHGIPMGGGLDIVDGATLSLSLRRRYSFEV